MQIKIFTIPVHGGEALEKDLNTFLRSKKILQIEQALVQEAHGSSWTFCVRYIAGPAGSTRSKKVKKDYKEELSANAFERFMELRKARKILAEEDAVPAFAIFTDEQMAHLAQQEQLSSQSIQAVKGIGEKKTAKYSECLLALVNW